MNGLDVLSLLAVVGILGLLVLIIVRRFRTVEAGHVAVVHIFGRYSRTVPPGIYFLWPLQKEIIRINVRRREVPSLMIGGIFTNGGLPLSVELAYTMLLVPDRMKTDELYYSEKGREDQQIRIFRKILQELIMDADRPTPQDDKNSVDFGMLFSPFMGGQARKIRDDLEQRASVDLMDRGIGLITGSLVISRLHIPESITTAYTELLTSNFSSAARYQFIKRVRSAAGTMSDSGLVQLLNAIEENPANIHSIFSTGSVQPNESLALNRLKTSLVGLVSLSEFTQTYLNLAGFVVKLEQDSNIYHCTPEHQIWRNHFPFPVTCKVVSGEILDSDTVLALVTMIRNRDPDRPHWIMLICDRTPSNGAWYQIAAQRDNQVQVMPVDSSILIAGQQKERHRDELLEFLERHFLGPQMDLYDEARPMADALNFFGREKYADQLMAYLTSGSAVALFGIRKMGKSSLLNYIRNKLPYATALVDLQGGVELRSVYTRILREWQRDLQSKVPALDWQVPDLLSSADPSAAFTVAATALLDQLAKLSDNPRLVILLDEIERIMPRDREGLERYLQLSGALRGLAQERAGNVGLCIAGVDPAIVRNSRFEGEQNPFYSFFREEYLSPLDMSDCVQMILNIGGQMDVRYSQDAADFIAYVSGGHPYWARKLCSLAYHLWQDKGEMPLHHVHVIAKEFIMDPAVNYLLDERGLWGEVTDSTLWSSSQISANESILTALAEEKRKQHSDLIGAAPSLHKTHQNALYELNRRSILDKPTNTEYAIHLQLFRNWIRSDRLGEIDEFPDDVS